MLYCLIDNGHGATTSGKASPDRSILEYLYAREIAAALYSRLIDVPDIKPVLIVPELQDISLQTRVRRINKYCDRYGAKNCIMISIHLNAAGSGAYNEWTNATGWECWTTRGQNNSDFLAECMYDAAEQTLTGQKIRTDYTDGDRDKEAGFAIIKGANCPAVLTENFFMDNKTDAKYLLSEQGFNNIVDVHVQAILKWQQTMG